MKSKKSKINKNTLTVAHIRAMAKQLMALPPAKMPTARFLDLFVKDRGWYRFTNFAVWKIDVIQDELIYTVLSEEDEKVIRKEAEIMLDEIKNSERVINIFK
jgi:hypothetical protein